MAQSLAAFPQIETDRLVIRPLAMADACAVCVLTNDPVITDAIHFLPAPFTFPDAEALIGRNDQANCFLGVWSHTELVGVIGTHTHGIDRVEVGYWIGSAFQRRGYAHEAVSGVIAELRHLYPDRQVMAECRVGNRASWSLLNKLGFRATGQQGHRPGRALLVIPPA